MSGASNGSQSSTRERRNRHQKRRGPYPRWPRERHGESSSAGNASDTGSVDRSRSRSPALREASDEDGPDGDCSWGDESEREADDDSGSASPYDDDDDDGDRDPEDPDSYDEYDERGSETPTHSMRSTENSSDQYQSDYDNKLSHDDNLSPPYYDSRGSDSENSEWRSRSRSQTPTYYNEWSDPERSRSPYSGRFSDDSSMSDGNYDYNSESSNIEEAATR